MILNMCLEYPAKGYIPGLMMLGFMPDRSSVFWSEKVGLYFLFGPFHVGGKLVESHKTVEVCRNFSPQGDFLLHFLKEKDLT